MSGKPAPHVTAMEGKGVYNRSAAIPAAGGALAVPRLEEAAARISLDADDRPLVIADYGASQGRNSLHPVRAAIKVLRSRAGPGRPIAVFHTDLPVNDFGTLFDVVQTDPESYVVGEPNVFPCAIGRSFYQSILPPDYVDLGWSSYAAVWLSQIPMPIPDHFMATFSTGAVRAAFERQAAEDWAAFLTLRARELRPGGRLVISLPSLTDDGKTAFAPIMHAANAVLSDLVTAGAITAEERGRLTLATYPRRRAELLAPFEGSGEFQRLVVEHCSVLVAPDIAWTEYEADKDVEALARKRAMFFRAIFVPSLAQSLSAERSVEERQAFAAQMEAGMRQRLLGAPARIDHLVAIITLDKQGLG
jgi:SAM dependent carboxyl methyltransferase